jgi:hypothetical protein
VIDVDGASPEAGGVDGSGDLPDATLDDAGPDSSPVSNPDAASVVDTGAPSSDGGAVVEGGSDAAVASDASGASGDGAACGAPSGTYTGSCTNCVVTANTLTCSCMTGSGSTTASSSLDLCACPNTATISNASGVLTCCGNPGGSYTSSCNECATTGTVLGCTCKTSNGGVLSSFLPLCSCQPPMQISNSNGILTCGQ